MWRKNLNIFAIMCLTYISGDKSYKVTRIEYFGKKNGN